MKKTLVILKNIGIILFVLLAVGVAGLLFYNVFVKKNLNKLDVTAMSVEMKNDDLLTKISEIDSVLNSEGTDERLGTMESVITTLNNSLTILGEYYVKDSILNDEKIKASANNMKESKTLFLKMHDEYLEKSKNPYFPRHEGANDIFNTLAGYIVNYSDLIVRLNAKVADLNVDTTSDVTFALIDLYSRITKKTYSSLNELNYDSLHNVTFVADLQLAVSTIEISNSGIVGLAHEKHSQLAVQFTRAYFACDKDVLSSNLSARLDEVSETNKSESKENLATYLFALLIGRA